MNDIDLTCTLLERREEAEATLNTLLPKKSREAFDKEYNNLRKTVQGDRQVDKFHSRNE
jgi:hypothetical protein